MADRLVYSTDGGRVTTCPVCAQAYKHCRCTKASSANAKAHEKKSDDIVQVMRDRKHRGGKTVTVITGVPADRETITALSQQLKKLCGSGGTSKDGAIEIQGDHCDKIEAKLTQLGYKVKHAGG